MILLSSLPSFNCLSVPFSFLSCLVKDINDVPKYTQQQQFIHKTNDINNNNINRCTKNLLLDFFPNLVSLSVFLRCFSSISLFFSFSFFSSSIKLRVCLAESVSGSVLELVLDETTILTHVSPIQILSPFFPFLFVTFYGLENR